MKARRLCVPATLVALAVLTGTAHAQTYSWNLASQFPTSSDGITVPTMSAPWSYGEANYSGAPSATYHEFTQWSPSLYFSIQGWQDATNGFPYIGENTDSTSTSPSGVGPGEVVAHPYPDTATDPTGNPVPTNAVVRWTSPITGTISITATFQNTAPGAGDGTKWSIDKYDGTTATNVASGTSYGPGSTVTTPSYANSSPLAVTAGDSYYFSVNDGGFNNYSYDSTVIDLTITGADTPVAGSPSATVSPTSLTFGKVRDGKSKELAVTVANAASATASLNISAMANSGASEFSIDSAKSTCSTATPVAAGSSCTIVEKFTPTNSTNAKTGVHGTLTITDDDTTSPQTVTMTGK